MPHPLPPLRTLDAFEAASRLRSYSRAAGELGVTHGAISHRIRELEAFTGRTLFRRSGNQMIPTVEAQRLLPRVREALAILREVFPEERQVRQTLKISVLPSFAGRWLVPRLGAFRAAHPKISIELDSRLDHARIGPGGVDAAIRYGGGDWPDLQAQRIASETLIPVCTPEYRDRMALTGPADLGRCVLLRDAWHRWTPWLRVAGLDLPEPKDGPVYSDAGLLIEAAAAGQGVALARSLLAAPDLIAGRLVRLWDIGIADISAYHFVTGASPVARHPALAAFREWLVPALAQACAESGFSGGGSPFGDRRSDGAG